MNRSVSTGNLLGMAIRNNVNMNNNPNNMNNPVDNGMNNMMTTLPPNDPNVINTTVKIGIRHWQNSNQADLLNFIYRNSGITLQNIILEGPLLVGFVPNRIQADRVMKCDGMNYAGNRLKVEIMNGRVPTTSNTVEFLRNVILKRYDTQSKMLNLGDLYQDQDLISKGMLASVSTRSRTFPALIKIASEEPGMIIESVNLADNQLRDITPIATLPKYFPHLKNLCLANNQISRTTVFDSWRNKFIDLKELLMLNNSVIKYHGYKNDMLKIFPKLIMLDNVMVRDQAKVNAIYNFPVKLQQFFFENNQLSSSAGEFVTNFLNCWDNDRTQLLPLYTPDSQFSMAVDGSIPSVSVTNSDQTPSFGYYIPYSRNMTKISNDRTRQIRLAKGSNEIANVFQNFPKTKHYLQNDPIDYKMEAISFPQINGFMVTLHGYFEEVEKPQSSGSGNSNTINNNNNNNSNDIVRTQQRSRRYASSYNNTSVSSGSTRLSKKCFDRTWTLVPMNNTIVIASEMLTVRAFTSNSWAPVDEQQQQQQKQKQQQQQMNPPSLMPPILTPPPSQSLGVPITPGGLQLPPNVNLNQQQIDLINKLHGVTKLNYQYTCMLAEQSSWNFDQAVKNFQMSVNNLPREAFIQ